jgi:hypothetical protein
LEHDNGFGYVVGGFGIVLDDDQREVTDTLLWFLCYSLIEKVAEGSEMFVVAAVDNQLLSDSDFLQSAFYIPIVLH